MDTTAMIYMTRGGATGDYAAAITDTFRKRGHLVDMIDLRRTPNPDLSQYRNVVVGSGVRMGRIYTRARRFLRHAAFNGKRLAIFVSSGIANEDPEGSRQRFLKPLVEKFDLHPVMFDAFPGWLPGNRAGSDVNVENARAWAESCARRFEGRPRRAA